MADKIKLEASKREATGRKVKSLRKQGILPGSVYGKKVKSTSIQLDNKTFTTVLSSAGETAVINLNVKGEEAARPVLVHQIQRHPVTDEILHVDFYQVDLKEKVTVNIPIELIGEPEIVNKKQGILIQPINEVEVEALPTDLPEKFEIDVGKLSEVGSTITVADLKVPTGVTILTGSEQVLAKIDPLAEEVVAPAPVVEAAPVEGETPAVGEQVSGEEQQTIPTEEKAPEKA